LGHIFFEANQLVLRAAGLERIFALTAAQSLAPDAGSRRIGMKRMLLASAVALTAGGQALAADLPPPMAPPPRAPAAYIPMAPAYNWSGFYIGGNLGGAFTSGSFNGPAGTSVSSSTNSSFLGGGQVGVNYEFYNGVVIGAEAMFDWAPNTKNTMNLTTAAGAPIGSATVNNRWLTTATGKLGYAWDRVLLYGKGGGAWVGSSASNATLASGAAVGFSGPSTNSGWTAGLGVEWAFAGNWSARAEYDYVGLTNQTYTFATTPATSVSSSNRSINIVTAGLNYKFGWGGGWW
jgi:outer membrane immunogenic protein